MIMPYNTAQLKHKLSLEVSRTFLRYVDIISSQKDLPILDAPCGYGRHAFLLANMGCKVTCVDIDEKALDCVESNRKEYGFRKNQIVTKRLDLQKYTLTLPENSFGAIVNIHYYQHNLLAKFIELLTPNGYLYFETPDNRGKNYLDLPIKGIIRNEIEKLCDFILYSEKLAGPSYLSRVTVKLLAKKRN